MTGYARVLEMDAEALEEAEQKASAIERAVAIVLDREGVKPPISSAAWQEIHRLIVDTLEPKR